MTETFIEFKVHGSDDEFIAGPMSEQGAEEFLWELPRRQVEKNPPSACRIRAAKKVRYEEDRFFNREEDE